MGGIGERVCLLYVQQHEISEQLRTERRRQLLWILRRRRGRAVVDDQMRTPNAHGTRTGRGVKKGNQKKEAWAKSRAWTSSGLRATHAPVHTHGAFRA